jgi:hypothetical protein
MFVEDPTKAVVGCKFIVVDTVDKDIIATVMDVKGDGSNKQLYFQYHGWSAKWNEWISADSKRIKSYKMSKNGRRRKGRGRKCSNCGGYHGSDRERSRSRRRDSDDSEEDSD